METKSEAQIPGKNTTHNTVEAKKDENTGSSKNTTWWKQNEMPVPAKQREMVAKIRLVLAKFKDGSSRNWGWLQQKLE